MTQSQKGHYERKGPKCSCGAPLRIRHTHHQGNGVKIQYLRCERDGCRREYKLTSRLTEVT